jgi:hypothetical protein
MKDQEISKEPARETAAVAPPPPPATTTDAHKPTWRQIIKSAEMIGLVLAIVGIIFAWQHERDLEHTTDKLERIEHSISTRPIGRFPDFVDVIEKTVRGAKRSLIVACDFPAYGEFDDKGLPIQHAIEDKIHQVKTVSLTFFVRSRRDSARRAQFPESEWNSTMDKGGERQKMLTFLARHGYVKPAAPRYPDFIATMGDYDDSLLSNQFRGADARQVANDMPLFFWIADDSEAVMVVQTPGGHEDSAFWTRDPQLIAALKSVASDYRSAVPCSPSGR